MSADCAAAQKMNKGEITKQTFLCEKVLYKYIFQYFTPR